MSMLQETVSASDTGSKNSIYSLPARRKAPRPASAVVRVAEQDTRTKPPSGEFPEAVLRLHLRRQQLYLVSKRFIDFFGSLLAIMLFAPLMLAAAIVIRLTDWGPVFYVHRRVGLNGREFNCLKFRSMVIDAESQKVNLEFHNVHDDLRTFKIPDDPRVTWIGRWLRRSSIDEMPQLFNVLLGDMSIVGPRPPVPNEVERYSRHDWRRLDVKPGLTCIWQVSGRSRLAFKEQLRLDLEYIEKRSHWMDLKLILKTLPAVFSADGAY